MRQLTLDLDDKDMAQLEAMARERRTDPAAIAKAELLKMLIPAASASAGPDDADAAKHARRSARLAALAPSSGIWTGEPNKPKDGVAYQEEMRAEWP